MKKVKVTQASKNDKNKITIRCTELGVKGMLTNGSKLVVVFKGQGKTTHEVILTGSRNGTTFYGSCPRGLKMPSVGKPKYYQLVGTCVEFYRSSLPIEVV